MQTFEVAEASYKIFLHNNLEKDEDVKFAWYMMSLRVKGISYCYGVFLITNKRIWILNGEEARVFLFKELDVKWLGPNPTITLNTFFTDKFVCASQKNSFVFSNALEFISNVDDWNLQAVLFDGDLVNKYASPAEKLQKFINSIHKNTSGFLMPAYKLWAVGQYVKLLHVRKDIYKNDLLELINGLWDQQLLRIIYIGFPILIIVSVILRNLLDKLNISSIITVSDYLLGAILLGAIAFLLKKISDKIQSFYILYKRFEKRNDLSLVAKD